MSKLSRQDFLRLLTLGMSGAVLDSFLAACSPQSTPETAPALSSPTATPLPTGGDDMLAASTSTTASADFPHLVVARSSDPGTLVRSALDALGGIQRFVKQGADVIVKPNICNGYNGPEYASTTNPQVVAAIVALCVEAGAGSVRVMDYPFGGTAQNAYNTSGIAQAVEAAGGRMELMNSLKYQEVEIPNAQALKKTKVYAEILNADTVINVPIAKHHSGARLTLGLKNLMGVVLDRGALHASGLHQSIADLGTVVKPQLTVIDATRILVANGPTGGNLDDVRQMDTVIASADVVAADAYAATLFDMTGADIGYITIADQLGLGTMDLTSINIQEIGA